MKNLAKQIFWLMLDGRALRDANSVLFTTEEERDRARGSFKGYTYHERVVVTGTADVTIQRETQIAAFKDLVPNLADRRFLLFLSRIHPKKGCDLLLRAFAQCADRYPDVDLVMAGPDQVGWKPKLEEMARELGIAHRIHWTGMLNGDAKWGAFLSAEAFVLPSHQENFGVVVAEAMACKLPVLITNKVNTWREVQTSGGGLVASDDLDGMSKLLQTFLALPATERHDMRQKAREGFLTYFDVAKAAADLGQIVREAGRQ
jgi:glycosyltransferase involved in cell wall biosynthesis